jgi:hypothetical protein
MLSPCPEVQKPEDRRGQIDVVVLKIRIRRGTQVAAKLSANENTGR